MKTLIDIREDILREAMEVSEAKTKKEVVTIALEELIKARLRQKLKQLAGSGIIETKLPDLKKMRQRRDREHRNLRKTP